MVTLTIRDIEIDDEAPMLLVGMGEYSNEEGLDIIFTANLRNNDYQENSNWPEGESYCVTDTEGLTSFGGVSEVDLKTNSVRIVFSEKTARVMRLPDREILFQFAPGVVDANRLSSALKRIFTCGRPEYHPRLTGFQSEG
ncbi:hypothetical protein ABZZ74_37160 [Streptomyces sp. NPDC006476]|uniref:hypothetical protein n=1 Tax=Streptomyces sp. NPDC006476 TaxID=3157175 RepID=UPI0033A9A5B3